MSFIKKLQLLSLLQKKPLVLLQFPHLTYEQLVDVEATFHTMQISRINGAVVRD